MPRKQNKVFNDKPYAYHEELTVDITGMTNLGVGIGRHEGWVIMVPFALTDETITVKVWRNHKNYSDADLIEVIKPSPLRVEPQCHLFGVCGGCQYQNLQYDAQLKMKRSHVIEIFKNIGDIDFEVNDLIPSPKTYGYRSKNTPHFQKLKKDRINPIGFLKFNNRQIIDVPHCPIATDAINRILPEERNKVLSYEKKFRRGGTLLLRDTLEGVITDHNEIVSEKIGEYVFQFQAGEFFQTNPFILPQMVDYVIGQAQHEKSRYLIDAYCGVGVFCISAGKYFEQCAGIEISHLSIHWANANAKINSVGNCSFLIGNAESIFENIDYDACESSIIIDPPRKGCDKIFIEQLLSFRPARIVYVSCDPATQARDLNFLTGNYNITNIQPFDFFPHTRHIENIVTLCVRK